MFEILKNRHIFVINIVEIHLQKSYIFVKKTNTFVKKLNIYIKKIKTMGKTKKIVKPAEIKSTPVSSRLAQYLSQNNIAADVFVNTDNLAYQYYTRINAKKQIRAYLQ